MNSITHFGVYVRDLKKSEKFYTEVLEGKKSGVINGGGKSIAFIDFPGGTVELIEFPERGEIIHTNNVHIAFKTEDIDGEYARVSAHKVDFIHTAPMEFNDGKLFFFRGPDGEELEYCQGVRIDKA